MAPLQVDPSSRKRQRYQFDADGNDQGEEFLLVVRKRVCFALQPCTTSSRTNSTVSRFGESIAETITESRLTHSDLNKNTLWWSKEERTGIADFNRKFARGFKRQNTERVNHYLHVFDEASKAPSHSTSDYLESATLGVPTEVRGLECGFVPTIKAYRKQHSKEVLDTQEQLMKGRMSEVMCRRVLSARAIRSSRPSRVMARLMGEADADLS